MPKALVQGRLVASLYARELSSQERAPEIADLRRGTSSAAQQTIDLYSTEGPIGISIVADPTDATFKYSPNSSLYRDHF